MIGSCSTGIFTLSVSMFVTQKCLSIVGDGKLGWVGRTIQKLSHLGVPRFLLERGVTLKRGGGDVEMGNGGVSTFLSFYSSITFTVCIGECGKSKVFLITFWFFNLLIYPCEILIQVFTVLKHCIICIFLIHSDSAQKMSTAFI